MHLVKPTREGQRRIYVIDTIIPIRLDLVAAWRGEILGWQTVLIGSDASLKEEVP